MDRLELKYFWYTRAGLSGSATLDGVHSLDVDTKQAEGGEECVDLVVADHPALNATYSDWELKILARAVGLEPLADRPEYYHTDWLGIDLSTHFYQKPEDDPESGSSSGDGGGDSGGGSQTGSCGTPLPAPIPIANLGSTVPCPPQGPATGDVYSVPSGGEVTTAESNCVDFPPIDEIRFSFKPVTEAASYVVMICGTDGCWLDETINPDAFGSWGTPQDFGVYHPEDKYTVSAFLVDDCGQWGETYNTAFRYTGPGCNSCSVCDWCECAQDDDCRFCEDKGCYFPY